MARANRVSGFRLARWLRDHSTSPREASKAWAMVSLSWLVRGRRSLGAAGRTRPRRVDSARARLPLCIRCRRGLPIAPAGAATQAGAGAAMLVASGVGATQAIAFAVAAQGLAIMMGALILVVAGLWQASLAPAADAPSSRKTHALRPDGRVYTVGRVRHPLRQAPARPRRPSRQGPPRRGSDLEGDARDPARAARGRRQLQGRQGLRRAGPRARDRAGGAEEPQRRPAGRQDRPRGADGADGAGDSRLAFGTARRP